MATADLIKRANEFRAKYRALEKQRGSGYHDEDRNPANPSLYGSPQRNGSPVGSDPPPEGWAPRMSDRLVAFFDHDGAETVTLVGDDATRAHSVLQAWLKKNGKGDPSNLPGTQRKLILRLLPQLALTQTDGHPRLTVWLCDWNDVLHALQAENADVAGLPLEPEE